MKVKQFVFCIALVVNTLYLSAQTGIGTTTPHASAKLDVSATNKGFLPPRVTLTSGTDNTTIPSPAEGLLVYNLGSVGLKSGYYYWNGANWATIATASSPDQMVDYVSVTLSSNQTVETGSVVLFNSNIGGNIPYNTSTGMFSLIAGKTYRLTGVIAIASTNTTQKEVNVAWRTAAGDLIGGRGEALSSNFTTTAFGSGIADVIYTPTVNTTISLTVNYGSGTVILWQNFTYANIQQIGSSATVNPWILSGTNTYTTTGNVGIGTTNPTSRLNISGGGIRIHNGFPNTTTRPPLTTSSIGNFEIRGVGSITGSTQEDGGDDGFLRLSAGGGTGVSSQSSIDISGFSTIPDMSNNIVMRTGGAERLRIDPSGNVNITGKLNIGDPTGNVSTKLVGRVTTGNFLTFDNLRFSVTNSGGLILATTSGSVNFYVEGRYSNGGAYIQGSRTTGTVNYTTTPSTSLFGWGFGSAGDTIIYHFTDPDNSRMYRVTLIIMPSYINNFIAIERLL